MTAYPNKTFSVHQRGGRPPSECARVGHHAEPDMKGRCFMCGEQIVTLTEGTAIITARVSGPVNRRAFIEWAEGIVGHMRERSAYRALRHMPEFPPDYKPWEASDATAGAVLTEKMVQDAARQIMEAPTPRPLSTACPYCGHDLSHGARIAEGCAPVHSCALAPRRSTTLLTGYGEFVVRNLTEDDDA